MILCLLDFSVIKKGELKISTMIVFLFLIVMSFFLFYVYIIDIYLGFPGGASGKQSESEVAQLCPTLCDLMDCSPPGSSIHGIF